MKGLLERVLVPPMLSERVQRQSDRLLDDADRLIV